MTTTHVWYAAYGSNCDDDRFRCYLAGGRPQGSTHDHVGCRDATPPSDVATVEIPHPVYFGGWSPFWRGAVAYVDPEPDPDVSTLAVARRIRVEQFADVVAQESGHPVPGPDLPLDDVVAQGRVDLDGSYGTVLAAGAIEGEPVVTCTSATVRDRGDPAGAYLATIRRGLARFHADEVLGPYLRRLVGVATT